MAFTDDTRRLVDELRADAARITDARARQLTEAWIRAWDLLSTEFDDAVSELLAIAPGQWPTRTQINRAERTRRALDHARERLDGLAAAARVSIADDAAAAAAGAAAAQERIVASQLPTAGVGLSWTRPAVDALDAIAERTTQQITALTRPLAAGATERMKAALVRGVAIGENPRTTAAAMLRGIETEFNGGLTRALTISRTEILDAHRAGAKAAHDANQSILTEWRWLADLSTRTCPACLALNGSTHPLAETGPDGHPNCRCARVPITKSWRDLGIDLDEPADVFPDARAWFDSLPPGDQAQVMGPGRLAALRSGAASWDDLATKRQAAGWRDAWHPTPVSALTA